MTPLSEAMAELPPKPSLVDRVRNPRLFDVWAEQMAAWRAAHPDAAAHYDAEEKRLNEEAQKREEDERRDYLEKAITQRLAQSDAPERLIAAAQTARDTEAVHAVREFMAGLGSSLLLIGAPGAGKSVAGVVAILEHARQHPGSAHYMLDNPRQPLFRRAAALSRMGLFGDGVADEWRRLHRAPLLVLDDLGAELLSDSWRALLDELIDARYSERLKTVITTNLDGEAFKVRYGDRIADRIRHDGKVVKCGNQSLRRAP